MAQNLQLFNFSSKSSLRERSNLNLNSTPNLSTYTHTYTLTDTHTHTTTTTVQKISEFYDFLVLQAAIISPCKYHKKLFPECSPSLRK